MKQKMSYFYGSLITLLFCTLLAACGDTPTSTPAATTAAANSAATTTIAVTTQAATTAGTPTAASTTVVTTSTTTTTLAATTATSTTAAATTASATTAAALTTAPTTINTSGTIPPTTALTAAPGQIIVQVQVPTTAGKAPTFENFQGEKYFNVEMDTGETVQLVPSQGFKWVKSEVREDSQTLGVINYWLYGEVVGGPIVLQAQVPTTDDKAPTLENFQGEKYYNIQTAKGGSLQVIAVSGFNWTGSKLNPDSTVPGIINYLLNGESGTTTPAATTSATTTSATSASTTTTAAVTTTGNATTAVATTTSATSVAQSQVTCTQQYTDAIAKFQDAVMKEVQVEREEATQKDGIARPALTWNAQLACQSQEWAQALSTKTFLQSSHCCYFNTEHSNPSSWKLGAPEGLAMGPTTAVGGVQAWRTGEMQYFDFSASEAAKRHDHTCFSGKVCGHYGAVIGLFTTDIGCGFFLDPTGGNRNYTACQYVFKYPR